MTLQFVTGTSSTDHQTTLIQMAREWLLEPNREVFFLVPNYNKFEREMELLTALKEAEESQSFSTIKSQVYSFQRLSWYFLERAGHLGKPALNETGSTLLMRKVLTQISEQLVLYRREVSQKGFIAQLLELYQEFQLGKIEMNNLMLPAETKKQSTQEANFQMKLKELQLIFLTYEEELAKRDLQIEQPLVSLTNFLTSEGKGAQALLDSLQQTKFIVSGFSKFSAQEFALLQVLMMKANLCVDVVMDQAQSQFATHDLFFEGKETYQLLKQFALDQQIPVYFDQKAAQLTEVSPSFHGLETHWRTNQRLEQEVNDFVEIWQVATPEEELRQIAVEIKRLMSQSKKQGQALRYRDIQLLTLTPAVYYPLLPSIFKEMSLPFYLDENKKMEEHPLIEMIQALFVLPKYHYRLKDIFRFLRSELYIPKDWSKEATSWQDARNQFRYQVDLTENVALAHQFQGNTWLKEADWQLIDYDFEASQMKDTQILTEQTNQVRQAFRRDIVTFFKQLKKATTIREGVTLFYQMLVDLDIEGQLIHWRDQAIENGALEEARNHEQTWDSLMDLLDQFVEINGDDPFEWSLFEEMLTSGLTNAQFGKIPTAIDQIKVNPLDLARPLQGKVTFAIGLDEATFPRKVENATLLSREERAFLNTYLPEQAFIRDRQQETIRQEPFVAYNVFLSGSQKLYLTYAASHDEKQKIQPSTYLKRLNQAANVPIQVRKPLSLASPLVEQIGSYRGLVRQVNQMTRQVQEEKVGLPKAWRILKEALLQSPYQQLAKRALTSQMAKNIPTKLSEKTTKKLYGKDIYTSVSRMETFYECQYKYFANFGLRLKEREIYGLSPIVTGEFFHDALDHFLNLLIQANVRLADLKEADKQIFVNQVLQEIFGKRQYHLLDATPRMQFIRYQLGKTIERVTWALHQQGTKSQFEAKATEVLFGQVAKEQGVPGLELPLISGGKLFVRGKIDRIDTAVIQGETWLSVVDYKSSRREFNLTDAYFGLAMQLITYLDVALKDASVLLGIEEAKAAGAYYFHVQNPLVTVEGATEKERLKTFKYEGLFVDHAEVFPLYDQSLAEKEYSSVFPIRADKDGKLTKVGQSANKFYQEEEIERLRAHNQKNLIAGGNQIQSGDIQLNPFYQVTKKKTACEFCAFRSVCNFDVMLPENQYHRITPLTKEEIMKKMEGEQNG